MSSARNGTADRAGSAPGSTATRALEGAEQAQRCANDAASMSHRAGTARTGQRWRWLAFGTVITAAVMDLLDSTITQVAAPTIRHDLGGSYAVIEWVTAAYALSAIGRLVPVRRKQVPGYRPRVPAMVRPRRSARHRARLSRRGAPVSRPDRRSAP